jgi:hypothetical protein
MLRVCAVILVTGLLGCGGGGQDKVYPVTGKITYKGEPMKGGGSIAFIPIEDRKGKSPGGVVNPDGTFAMGTYTLSDGSMPGTWRVVINQETVAEPQSVADGSGKKNPKSVQLVEPAFKIPYKYSDMMNTPLTATVKEENNVINFDLVEKP